MKNKNETKNKKKIFALLLVVLLAVVSVSTTIAWLTKTSKLTNTFTVGTFTNPITNPKDPSQTIDIEGNLYEPSWNEAVEHKLVPGVSFEKDPYVGIGKKSEDAVVYVYVENNFSNKVYFNINAEWQAVDGYVERGSLDGTYKSGLFKYNTVLEGKEAADSWTTNPLFNNVIVDDTADISDLTVPEGKNNEIVVSSFIHQAKDANDNLINETEILEAAKTTFNIN